MIFPKTNLIPLFATALLAVVDAGCPHMKKDGTFVDPEAHRVAHHHSRRLSRRSGDGGIPDGGFDAVRADLTALMTDSKPEWPADFGNYAGLFGRLAWHCSGSYRDSDGRGGCDGGRIRFDPELNWMDNGNLDKALMLLEPIKEKYGSKLSWGDLIVLAGTTGMEAAGHPKFGFCGGRIDDPDGSKSLILGPNEAQEALTPCQSIGEQGNCQSPLGPSTIGLIYVNPEGPVGATGDPMAAAEAIRDVFGRMGFNDRESVALIGGGHAFGKCHGACAEPPCGEGEMQGKGENTFTSGLEGKWTTQPTKWTNEFFRNLFDFEYRQTTSPAGAVQYEPIDGPDTFMLTTDLALGADPEYERISLEFADNITTLEEAFGPAWYRLMSADMGPATRCIGDDALPPQPWQHTLAEGVDVRSPQDYIPIRAAIQELIDGDSSNIGKFATLAQNCARTFRETDYRGGCNGARIRFSPEADWDYNTVSATNITLAVLDPVKTAFPLISYSDLIVLAGNTAVEAGGGNEIPFCGGRVDAEDGAGSEGLGPRVYATPYLTLSDYITVSGLTPEEGVALLATPKDGSTTVSNQYFKDLLEGGGEFTDYEKAALEFDLAAVVTTFIEDNDLFLEQYASGWDYMMTADRFKDSMNNACDGVDTPTRRSDEVPNDGANEVPSLMLAWLMIIGLLLPVCTQ